MLATSEKNKHRGHQLSDCELHLTTLSSKSNSRTEYCTLYIMGKEDMKEIWFCKDNVGSLRHPLRFK
jgi:hypothetical protein